MAKQSKSKKKANTKKAIGLGIIAGVGLWYFMRDKTPSNLRKASDAEKQSESITSVNPETKSFTYEARDKIYNVEGQAYSLLNSLPDAMSYPKDQYDYTDFGFTTDDGVSRTQKGDILWYNGGWDDSDIVTHNRLFEYGTGNVPEFRETGVPLLVLGIEPNPHSGRMGFVVYDPNQKKVFFADINALQPWGNEYRYIKHDTTGATTLTDPNIIAFSEAVIEAQGDMGGQFTEEEMKALSAEFLASTYNFDYATYANSFI
jgi:hypothetical protein